MAEMKSQPYCAAIGLAQLDAGDLGDGVPLVGGLERAGQQRVLGDRLRRQPAGRCRRSRGTAASRRRSACAASDEVGLDHQVVVEEVGRIACRWRGCRRPWPRRRTPPPGWSPRIQRLDVGLARAGRARARSAVSTSQPLAAPAGARAREPDHAAVAGDPDALAALERRDCCSSVGHRRVGLARLARRAPRMIARSASTISRDQLARSWSCGVQPSFSRALRGIAEQMLDLGRAEVARVDAHQHVARSLRRALPRRRPRRASRSSRPTSRERRARRTRARECVSPVAST